MNPEPKPFRGGRVFTDDETPIEQKPRQRYPCFAEGCPMPGTLWPGITQGGTGDRPGTCAWHYGVVPSDIPKVTSQLRAWECVVQEIRTARRVLSGDLACDVAAQDAAYRQAWERLQPLVAGSWEDQLRPRTIRTTKGVDTGHPQSYGDWAKHLERFLGARVVEVLSTHRSQA